MIRRIALGVSLILLFAGVAGCWSRIEVNDLAIITMMGIDRTEEGDFQLWLQIVDPLRVGATPSPGGGAGGGGGGGAAFVTVVGRGETILDASRTIQLQMPRRLFWSHVRVVLVGERLAKAGVRPALDFLTRHRELRVTSILMLVKGDLARLLEAQVNLERLPMEALREVSRSRIGTVVDISTFAQRLLEQGADPVMGVAEVVPQPPGAPAGQQSTLALSGTALFKQDKLVGYLDTRVTRGLLWLRGESPRGVVTFRLPRLPGHVTVEWSNASVKRRAILRAGKVSFEIAAHLNGEIGDLQGDLDLSDPAAVRLVEEAVAKEIRQRMELALEATQRLGVDAPGLGEIFHQQLPAAWQPVSGRWLRQEYSKADVRVMVDAHIQRSGLSTTPRGVPQEDLTKVGE